MAITPDGVAILAQLLRVRAESHNLHVRSMRARDKWGLLSLVTVCTPL